MTDFVSVDVADRVATITFDRPPMNALSLQLQREIADACVEADERDDVGAIVLSGSEKVFAAGADVKEMADLDYQAMLVKSRALQRSFTAVAQLAKPTIAAITGYALGGGLELALCCDLRVAADNVKVGQPEILLGIIPGAGGTQRLTRLIGPAHAKDLIFSGRFVDADEAKALGIVNRVVPAADVLTEAKTWAAQLAAGPALALAAAKRAIDGGLDVDLATGLEIERKEFASLFATDDQRLGMASFIASGPGKATFTHR